MNNKTTTGTLAFYNLEPNGHMKVCALQEMKKEIILPSLNTDFKMKVCYFTHLTSSFFFFVYFSTHLFLTSFLLHFSLLYRAICLFLYK
jgi:hypothetical protein